MEILQVRQIQVITYDGKYETKANPQHRMMHVEINFIIQRMNSHPRPKPPGIKDDKSTCRFVRFAQIDGLKDKA